MAQVWKFTILNFGTHLSCHAKIEDRFSYDLMC